MTAMYRVRTTVTGVAGAPYYLTGYFTVSGGTAQQASDAWFDFCNPGASALPVGTLMRSDATVFAVESETGQIGAAVAVTSESVSGTSANEFLPLFTQTLVRWQTGTYAAGRQIQGRTNLPCVPAGASINEVPSGTWTTSTNARAAALIADTDSEFVVYSRTLGTVAVVQQGTTWSQFAVLRSRRD